MKLTQEMDDILYGINTINDYKVTQDKKKERGIGKKDKLIDNRTVRSQIKSPHPNYVCTLFQPPL